MAPFALGTEPPGIRGLITMPHVTAPVGFREDPAHELNP